MAPVLAFSSVGSAAPGTREAITGLATCPSCHTTDPTMTNDAVSSGASWRCERCTQRWDRDRLAVVAAYTAWDLGRTTATVEQQPPTGGAQ